MAKSLKYFYEYKDYRETLHRVEIHVEGFAGTAVELAAGGEPFSIQQNKEVAQQYLGGLVPTKFKLQAVSNSNFNAASFVSENYGDVAILKKLDGVVEYEGILTPFESKDLDLPNGMFVTDLEAELGVVYLKNVTYAHTTNRITLLAVVKKCLDRLSYLTAFNFEVIANGVLSVDNGGVTTCTWFDSYINEENFDGLSCLDVLNEVIPSYIELTFDKSKWVLRDVSELNAGNSISKLYNNALTLLSTSDYLRPTATIQRLSGGSFGKSFSFSNITVQKEKSRSKKLLPIGEMDSVTGWTYDGGDYESELMEFADGKLFNKGFSSFQGSNNLTHYINAAGVSYFPNNNIFENNELEQLKISIKAESQGNLRNLRFQIIAVQVGLNKSYFLTNEGAWYEQVAGLSNTPIYEVPIQDQEFTITLPKPPHNPGNFLFRLPQSDGIFSDDSIIPTTNIEYKLFIKVLLPERLGSVDPAAFVDSRIDYIRVSQQNLLDSGAEGFERSFGGAIKADRTNNLPVKFNVGYPLEPSGLETLYPTASATTSLKFFKPYQNGTFKGITEYIADRYLSSLSKRLKTYDGQVNSELTFGSIVAIDSVKYRVHTYDYNTRTRFANVRLVELTTNAVTASVQDLTNPFNKAVELALRNIPREGLKYDTLFGNENFTSKLNGSGQLVIGLRSQLRAESLLAKAGEVFLRKEGNEAGTGLIWVDNDLNETDSIKPVTDGFAFKSEDNAYTAVLDFSELTSNVVLKVPVLAADSTIATDATAWMRGATNVLAAKDFIGSASGNFDIGIKRNGVEIATVKSTGIDIVGKVTAATVNATSLTTNYITKSGAGGLISNSQLFDNGTNIGLDTANPLSALHIAKGGGAAVSRLQRTTFSAGAVIGAYGFAGDTNDFVATITGHFFGADNTSGYLALRAGTSNASPYGVPEVVRILPNGVGIGTSPLSGTMLDVNGITRTTNLRITNNAAVGKVWQCNDADGSGVWTSPLASERYIAEWNAGSGVAPSTSPTEGDYYRVNGAGTYAGVAYESGDDTYWNGSAWLLRKNYLTLPKATDSILGGIKIGATLEIDTSGIVNQKTGVVTAGDYQNVTVDAYGRVTAGTNPTTIAGYGITDYDSLWASNYNAIAKNTAFNKDFGTSSGTVAEGNHVHTFASLTSKPTTIGGYGITDYDSLWDTRYDTEYNGLTTNNVPKWNGTKFVNSIVSENGGVLTVGGKVLTGAVDVLGFTIGAGFFSLGGSNHLLASQFVAAVFDINSVPQAVLNFKGKNTGVFRFGLSGTLGTAKQVITADATNGDKWATLDTSYLSDWSSQLATINTSIATKQNQLNGSGFVKANGTVISYDNNTYSLSNHVHTFASLTSKPTTIAGYGITDAYTKTESNGRYVDLASDQAITGIKNFTNRITVNDGLSIFHNATSRFTEFLAKGITNGSNSTAIFNFFNSSFVEGKINRVKIGIQGSFGGTDEVLIAGGETGNRWGKIRAVDLSDWSSQLATINTAITTKQSKFTQNGFVKLSSNGTTVNYLTTLAMSDISGLENSLNLLEPKFSKNTAFNKNFGTTSGTVAQGNDSRILNGQTAFGYGNHANAGYLTENFFEHQFSDGSGGVRNEYGLRFYDGDNLEKGRLTYDIENELVGFATTHVDESGSAFTMRNVFDDAGRLVQINGSGDARAYAFSDEIQSSGGSTTPGLQEVATVDPLTRIRIKYNEGTATSVAAYDFALVSDTQRLRYRANGQDIQNYALMSDLSGLGGSATPNLQSVLNEQNTSTLDIVLKKQNGVNQSAGVKFLNNDNTTLGGEIRLSQDNKVVIKGSSTGTVEIETGILSFKNVGDLFMDGVHSFNFTPVDALGPDKLFVFKWNGTNFVLVEMP
jgi:hypothetical protein